MYGACGVAWRGDELLVCVPDDAGDGGSVQVRVAPRGVRGVTAASLPWSDRPMVLSARDVAVSEAGFVAIADEAGVVHVLRERWAEIGRGVLERPVAVAWSGDALFVSDARRNEIVSFDAGGREVERFGSAQLIEPAGLACGADGAVFVCDRLGDCLWRFDAPSTAGSARAATKLGEPGPNPGQFSAPRDVDVIRAGADGAACLLVADELNHRIHVVTDRGEFVGFFGMHALVPRQGEGRIHYPMSVAVAPDGKSIAVAEAFEDRVQLLALTDVPPEPDPALGTITEVSSHFGSESAGRDDLFAVVDVETASVPIFIADRTPPIHIATVGGSGASPLRFGEVSALAIEPGRPRLWVADRVQKRIDMFDIVRDPSATLMIDQFIPRLAKSIDLAAFAARITSDQAEGGLRTPDVADMAFVTDAGGGVGVLLLDRANMAVLRTDLRFSAGEIDRLPADAHAPEELAVDGDRILVADPVARAVFMRDGEGWRAVRAIGGTPLLRPAGIASVAPGVGVLSDGALDGCMVWTGDESRVVGARGVYDEQFYQPESLSPTAMGWIVIDRGNHRFQRFSAKDGDAFAWNMTGGLGRWYDRKRRGSPGAPPRDERPAPAKAEGGGT
ncbi:MAG: NHL repeat-containing protein [Phycisphaerales bacterium]